MSCPGDLYVVPGAAPCAGGGGGGGVTTLNSLTGGINLTSVSGSLIIAPLGNDIDFTAGGVNSLNTLNGNLNLISSDASVTITPSGTDVDLTVLPGGVTSIVAGSNITISPTTGVGAVTVTAVVPVATLTGVGAAVVTEPTPGQFEVSVAPGNTNSLNSYIQSIGQLTGFDLPQGGAPQYIAIDLPGSFPTASLGLYSFVDIEVNVILTGTGAVNFGGGSCQFGFIWTTGVPSGVPATLEFAGTVAGSAFNPYSFSLGFIRVPTAQFAQPPGTTDLNLYIANTSLTSSPAVNFSIEWFASKHRATLTN